MSKSQPAAMGFDQILEKLRSAVEKLESGELTLEQSLTVYEEGVTLAREGQHILESAQKRVDLLMAQAGQPGQPVTSVPFDE